MIHVFADFYISHEAAEAGLPRWQNGRDNYRKLLQLVAPRVSQVINEKRRFQEKLHVLLRQLLPLKMETYPLTYRKYNEYCNLFPLL